MAHILVIEDERPMRTALVDTLRDAGHLVSEEADGHAGLAKAREAMPDLVLLDVMMPGLDGYTVCRALRDADLAMPILMLTAKGLVEDRVIGLDAGADDYVVKPFSKEELLARVRALLRRRHRSIGEDHRLRFGDVVIDLAKQTCRRANVEVHLTHKEFGMIQLLACHRGEAISRDRFLDVVWGYNTYVTTRTVDNHMASLRAKLEAQPDKPAFLLTVHRVGYRLAEE